MSLKDCLSLSFVLGLWVLSSTTSQAQVEAAKFGAADPKLMAAEQEYYPVVDLSIPWTVTLEATSFLEWPDGRLVVGTRRGDIFLVSGAETKTPQCDFKLFATGLHEVFGLAKKDGVLYATQQGEVTRIIDKDGDERADRYECVSDKWGYGRYHEFTYGSRFDADGAIWVAHCLSASYDSDRLFRGWAQRIWPDGRTEPVCSGIRSPGGIAMNAEGVMFYVESQGPWNGSCSLKQLKPGGFMGHPISFKWYDNAPNMGPRPTEPKGGRDVRIHEARKRIPQLVVPSVVLPYKKMGQSASAMMLDESKGKFGPFSGQFFISDYTLSVVMRVFMEKVDGEYQGACFPFRSGFKTGLIGGILTKRGSLITGGSNRGWPSRGSKAFALQRLRWSGRMPFEILEMHAKPDGFELLLTEPVDEETAQSLASYSLKTFTYRYQRVYGSPEVDHTTPRILKAIVSRNGRRVHLVVDGLKLGHVHELKAAGLKSRTGSTLLHDMAYYTLNAIPKKND